MPQKLNVLTSYFLVHNKVAGIMAPHQVIKTQLLVALVSFKSPLVTRQPSIFSPEFVKLT